MAYTYQLPPGKSLNESAYQLLVGRYLIENDHDGRVPVAPRKRIRGDSWNRVKRVQNN